MKNILLTFDVEEFDLPREFGIDISEKDMYEVSKEGLNTLLELLEKQNIKATFFTTANFAKKFPTLIRKMDQDGHEIASHGYSHSESFSSLRAKQAREEIERIINSKIKGFRAPRFEIENIFRLYSLGFTYDSSIHPTIAPGKYFNVHQKRKIHKQGKIIEIPLSTLPLFPFLRAPFNWYMFRHFPPLYGRLFAKINLSFSDYLMLIFHPWEFVDLKNYKIPKTFKKNSGEPLLAKLKRYIEFCKKKGYKFDTISNYLNL